MEITQTLNYRVFRCHSSHLFLAALYTWKSIHESSRIFFYSIRINYEKLFQSLPSVIGDEYVFDSKTYS